MGWDLCAGLFYEHRFAMLIIIVNLIIIVETTGSMFTRLSVVHHAQNTL